ncbi:MAG: hypothetical protein RSC43_00825 [Clostridia bacterium]
MALTKIDSIVELTKIQRPCMIQLVALVRDVLDLDDRARVTISDGRDVFFFTVWNRQVLTDFLESVVPGFIYQFDFFVDNKGKGAYIKQLSAWCPLEETEEMSRRFKTLNYNRLSDTNRNDFVTGIKIIEDPSLRRLVEVAYGTGTVPEGVHTAAYRSRLTAVWTSWGSIHRHDSYPGGYVNHVCDMLRIARKLQQMYEKPSNCGRLERKCEINWQYLFTLIYLHDIGKADTYESTASGMIRWKTYGKIKHNDLGMAKVMALYQEIEPSLQPDPEMFQKILYGIQKHGDISAFTSVDKNLTAEDKLLTLIDTTDAILVQCLSL